MNTRLCSVHMHRLMPLIEQASAQAQAILDSATEDANSIRQGAMDYTDDMLEKLQYIIEKSIRDNREKYDSLLSGLEKCSFDCQ